FAMRVGTKLRGHRGESVFDADFGDLGGHSMVAVGYDDAKQAFRIQNSWGRKWGDGGYAWFSYEFWKRNTRVGYVIDWPNPPLHAMISSPGHARGRRGLHPERVGAGMADPHCGDHTSC